MRHASAAFPGRVIKVVGDELQLVAERVLQLVDCGLVHIQDLIQRNVFHGEHLLQLFALCVQNMALSRFLQRNGLDEIGNGLAHGDGVRGCCDGGH